MNVKSLTLFLITLGAIMFLGGCSEDNESSVLDKSVWIHQFKPEENIIDAAGAALCFGKKQVEYYAIDTDFKILRLIEVFDYHLQDSHIVIGNQTYKLTEHTLMFSNKMFYLTDKRIEDMVQHESTNSQKDFQWDAIIDDRSSNNDIFIGNQYLGVQGWSTLTTAPYIYVGAAFPQSSFTASFDKEVAGKKHAVDLSFNFPNPYLTTLEKVNGSEYLQKVKDALQSDEYKSYSSYKRPHIVRFAELNRLSDIENVFDANPSFGKTIEKICNQEFDTRKTKSICLGEFIFKGFTISMDIPKNGLFFEKPSSAENLVYIRSLTYGVSAYCIVASESSYKDVLAAFKNSIWESSQNPQGVLHNAQVIFLITTDISQDAVIKESFEDLISFLKNPFQNGKIYGYPMYCLGNYIKDNSTFKKQPDHCFYTK